MLFGAATPPGLVGIAQAADSQNQLTIAPNLSHFTLDNGLVVVVIPDNRAPIATHMLWYKVGSADEPVGQSGVAHFLEHLMFKGTKDNPDGAFSKVIADLGGQENAFTSYDYTAYFQRVAKEHLPLMMKLEADRMANLVLSDEVVDPEREVVLEERRSRVDSRPQSRLGEALNAVTFVNHPYGSPVIGWESEIEGLNKESAIAFYDRFYTPNNAVLIVAGDVDASEVQALAEETYGRLPRRADPGARQRPVEPPLSGERAITLTDARVQQDSLSQTWVVPSATTADDLEAEALDVFAYVLGGGPTSRLHKALVLDEEIALSAGSYYQGSALNDGRFGIYATAADGTRLEDLEPRISAVLEDLIENGITEDELEAAKHRMVADAIYAQDSQVSLARIFGTALTTGQTIEDVQTWPARIQSVSIEDVEQAAEAYLTSVPVVGYLKSAPPAPDNAADAETSLEADRS
ncbi:insulinase family protein [Roseibium hamelinense]|nr:pitrilysin family protein [Roseibium hamelinense]MTI43379.1 insulinase family protein [Roseibium hamelinense]